MNSALLNRNIWDDVSGGEDDFNLEYMDLDEFLSETGLVDTNFSSMLSSATEQPQALPRPASVTSPPAELQTVSNLLNRLLGTLKIASRL